MKGCGNDEPVCPSVYLERLAFEMDKKYTETKLQLLLSPVTLTSSDLVPRPPTSGHLSTGFLVLESLQFRGHAMFSGVGRPLDSETLEYGWLVEVAAGDVRGRLTLPQLAHVVTSVETLLLAVSQSESSLQPPAPYQKCLHDLVQSSCPDSDVNLSKLCPYSEDLKYRMVRFEVTGLDVSLVELNALVNVRVDTMKMATCNLHSCHASSGVTLLVEKVALRQLIHRGVEKTALKASRLNIAGARGAGAGAALDGQPVWIEVASVAVGPLFIDCVSSPQKGRVAYSWFNLLLILSRPPCCRYWTTTPRVRTCFYAFTILRLDGYGFCGTALILRSKVKVMVVRVQLVSMWPKYQTNADVWADVRSLEPMIPECPFLTFHLRGHVISAGHCDLRS